MQENPKYITKKNSQNIKHKKPVAANKRNSSQLNILMRAMEDDHCGVGIGGASNSSQKQ
jgi:hypothetical protein